MLGNNVPRSVSLHPGAVCPSTIVRMNSLGVTDVFTERPGGKGAVRDVIERVLKAQGKWMTAEAYSW